MDLKGFMKTVKNEAGDAVEITKLKAKVSKEKTAIKDSYEEIGKSVYKKAKENGNIEPELAALVEKIDQSKAKIEQYNQEIERVKTD